VGSPLPCLTTITALIATLHPMLAFHFTSLCLCYLVQRLVLHIVV
jgi:hypothetical protein